MTIPGPDERTALFGDPDTLFSRATDQVSADLNGDMAILNLQTKTYFGLDGVGAFIWQKLDAPTDLKSLIQSIVDKFDVDQAQCRTDVIKFLEKLAASGLLNLTSGKH